MHRGQRRVSKLRSETAGPFFFAWSAGIPKGVRPGSITNRDVVPTIAKLSGIEWKAARGRGIPGIG
jgi:hypothetical protein